MHRLLFLLAVLMPGCSHIYDWQTKFPDNLAEEVVEDFIENKSGYNLDLTPITGDERQEFKK